MRLVSHSMVPFLSSACTTFLSRTIASISPDGTNPPNVSSSALSVCEIQTLAQLSILQAARVRGEAALIENVLHLGADRISLLQVSSHHEHVLHGPPPELPPGQVAAGQHEDSVQPGVDVDLPALLLHLHYPPHHHDVDLAVVPCLDGRHADEFVDPLHDAGHAGQEDVLVYVGAVAVHVALVPGDGIPGGHQLPRLAVVIEASQCYIYIKSRSESRKFTRNIFLIKLRCFVSSAYFLWICTTTICPLYSYCVIL